MSLAMYMNCIKCLICFFLVYSRLRCYNHPFVTASNFESVPIVRSSSNMPVFCHLCLVRNNQPIGRYINNKLFSDYKTSPDYAPNSLHNNKYTHVQPFPIASRSNNRETLSLKPLSAHKYSLLSFQRSKVFSGRVNSIMENKIKYTLPKVNRRSFGKLPKQLTFPFPNYYDNKNEILGNSETDNESMNVDTQTAETESQRARTIESSSETQVMITPADCLTVKQANQTQQSRYSSPTSANNKMSALSRCSTEDLSPLHKVFLKSLDQFQRKFYLQTFTKLFLISPPDRRENGISFVTSGLFLYLILMALSMEVDNDTRKEIELTLDFTASDMDKIQIIRSVVNALPLSSDELKFRWATRLVMNGSYHFVADGAYSLPIKLGTFNATESPENLVKTLNHMVEEDSGGAMRNTFEEDELSGGVRGVMLSTLYLRARWRSAPTLLNDSRPFHDVEDAPPRLTRMVRINDMMRYADLPHWDAEAVEISYSTPGLSLLLLVPRGRSLRALAERASTVALEDINANMREVRVAATLPIYTLRMTLLLPNKLEPLGIKRLLNVSSPRASDNELRLSHAEQRLMFWAEAGRNAFKDDGIEWDDAPEFELVVDRPYIFYVRWRNFTIMNGNFVL